MEAITVLENSSLPPFLRGAEKTADFDIMFSGGRLLLEKQKYEKYKIHNLLPLLQKVNTFAKELQSTYSIRITDEVYSYLLYKDFLILPVKQTIEKVQEYFSHEIKDLDLEVFYDPEDEDLQGELFLTVYTSLDVKNALASLEKFDREWFIPTYRGYLQYFNVDVSQHVSVE